MLTDQAKVDRVIATLTGQRYVETRMNPEAWGWCVVDTTNGDRFNGCSTLESCLDKARRLNELERERVRQAALAASLSR